MENNNRKIIGSIDHLVGLAEDGEIGYENASKDVKDLEIKNLFLRFSHERGSYVRQLKAMVSTYGEKIEKESGGPLGAVHRLLMDLKSAITRGDRNAIINACVTGEEAALKAYSDILDETYIEGELRKVLNEQYIGIQNAISSIKDHKESVM